MKIAVPYENGEVFQHFGHTQQFKIYTVTDGAVESSGVVAAMGGGHSALVGMLRLLGADAVICGGIGGGARSALQQAGIELYPGVTGQADDAVAALINGTLSYDPDTVCRHHDHEHGHDCGEHGHSCGEHNK